MHLIKYSLGMAILIIKHSYDQPRNSRYPEGKNNNLPYVAGISERIGSMSRDFSMRTEFKSRPALHYKVKVYVEETKRRLETRVKEHKDACTVSYSAI